MGDPACAEMIESAQQIVANVNAEPFMHLTGAAIGEALKQARMEAVSDWLSKTYS